MRLNRFLAQSGIASRRKCELIVRSGRVTVNGVKITNPFYLVGESDKVLLDGEPISPPRETIVILLNKPRGVLTTTADTHHRKTVMELVKMDARLFPIVRLDRDTTGVLLLTNNGDLAFKMTHPKFEVERIYQVTIDKPLSKIDKRKIETGVDIGEGEVGKGDVLDCRLFYSSKGVKKSNGSSTSMVRLRMKHGKKREVKRIFSSLGYKVLSLHRESFAGVDAHGLKIGQWRKLTPVEVEKLMSGN